MNAKHRQTIQRNRAIRLKARQRVEAAWTCVSTLCPDLPLHDRKALAWKILDLSRGEEQPPAPPIQITPAQVSEIVWRNFQCANRYCSAVLFTREIAEELNEFFKLEQGDESSG